MGSLIGIGFRQSLIDILLQDATLSWCLHGFIATGLLADLRDDGPFTLFLPRREALLSLPWTMEQLLADETLIDQRFDVFEYTIARGLYGARGSRNVVSLQGERLRVSRGKVIGRFGEGTILETLRARNGVVHVVDACLMPVDPAAYAKASA